MTEKKTFWPTIAAVDGDRSLVLDSFVIVIFLDQDRRFDTAPVEHAFEMFLSGVGRGHLHLYVDFEGDTRQLPSDPTPIFRDYISRPTQRADVTELRLLDTDLSKPHFQAQYVQDPTISSEEQPDHRGVIWFRVSQELFVTRRADVIAFARSLTEELPYTYGYASPALSYGESFSAALPFLRRHPGFDVVDPPTAAWDIGDGPMGPYWINFLGPSLTEKLGGIDALRSQLRGDFDVSPCGHAGACVTIGKDPQVGDVNRGDVLPLYREFAALLQPWLRTPKYVYFTDPGENGDPDAQEEWHQRFLR
jgi:hypothetical protein